MKRVFLILLMVMAVASLWAAPMTLTWMTNGIVKYAEGEDFRGYPGVQLKIAADFEKANPGVKVQVLIRDVSQGSLTVDSMMEKGTPPDIWFDAAGYFEKYLNAEYALPLQKYGDVKPYFKDLLDLYSRNGNVYGLPVSNICGGFAINLDMLADIGYTMPAQKDWTTDEFLSLGAKLKAKGYPLTMVMTKNGIDSWTGIFLYSFGAAFYKNGDYTKTTINSKEGIAGLNYIKKLIELGYAYPNHLEQIDDTGVELFTTGQVFSCMMQNGHTDYWIPEQLKQGKIKKAPNITFVEAPHAPGRAHTPVYGYQSIVVAHKSTDEARNKMVAKLAFAAAGKEMQWSLITMAGGFPTIKDWTPGIGTAASPSYKAIRDLAPAAGLQEQGPPGEKGAEVQRIWRTLTDQFIRGKLSAEQTLAQFEAQANKILSGK